MLRTRAAIVNFALLAPSSQSSTFSRALSLSFFVGMYIGRCVRESFSLSRCWRRRLMHDLSRGTRWIFRAEMLDTRLMSLSGLATLYVGTRRRGLISLIIIYAIITWFICTASCIWRYFCWWLGYTCGYMNLNWFFFWALNCSRVIGIELFCEIRLMINFCENSFIELKINEDLCQTIYLNEIFVGGVLKYLHIFTL